MSTMSIEQEVGKFAKYLTAHVSEGTINTYVDNVIRWIKYVVYKYDTDRNISDSDRDISDSDRNISDSDRDNVGNHNVVNSKYDNANNKYETVNSISLNGHLNPKTAQAYINMLTKSKKSPNTISVAGHAIMRFLAWRGMKTKLDIPSIKFGEPRYRTLDEVNQVLSVCRTPLETVMITLLFDTGARVSEILNLMLENIDWDIGTITVIRKGGRKDDINISSKSADALKAWLKFRKFSSKRVFGDLDYYATWKMVKRIGKRVDLELNPHIFRHSRAVHLLKNRVPINVVSQHLGHRNIMTTINIYGRFTAVDLKDQLVEF